MIKCYSKYSDTEPVATYNYSDDIENIKHATTWLLGRIYTNVYIILNDEEYHPIQGNILTIEAELLAILNRQKELLNFNLLDEDFLL